MNYKEFITLASQGKKLRDKTWGKELWIQMRDDGTFISSDGRAMHYQAGADVSEFEIFIEPVTFEACLAAQSVNIIFPGGNGSSDDSYTQSGGWTLQELSVFDLAIRYGWEIELS